MTVKESVKQYLEALDTTGWLEKEKKCP